LIISLFVASYNLRRGKLGPSISFYNMQLKIDGVGMVSSCISPSYLSDNQTLFLVDGKVLW